MKNKTKEKSSFKLASAKGGSADQAKKPDVAEKPFDAKEAEAEYKSILHFQTKQKNNLLGEFSADGKYAIKDERVLKALREYPKKYDDKNGSLIYVTSKIDDVYLNFRIELDMGTTFCKAKLSLIEVEHGIEEDVKHVTMLGEMEEVHSANFKENVYRNWKVYITEEVYDRDDFLTKKVHMQYEEFLFNRELTEILSQLMLSRLIKLLESLGEKGMRVLSEYKNLIEKYKKGDPSLLSNFTRLKELLDFAILKHNALPEILKTKEGAQILNGYAAPIKRVKDKATRPMFAESEKVPDGLKKMTSKDKDEKKAAPVAAKKPAAKSKGGGGKLKTYAFDMKKIGTQVYSPFTNSPLKGGSEMKSPTIDLISVVQGKGKEEAAKPAAPKGPNPFDQKPAAPKDKPKEPVEEKILDTGLEDELEDEFGDLMSQINDQGLVNDQGKEMIDQMEEEGGKVSEKDEREVSPEVSQEDEFEDELENEFKNLNGKEKGDNGRDA